MSATLQGEELIIDVPGQLSGVRRAGEVGLTAVAALIWLVVLRPVLLVGIWYLGFEAAYTHMVRLQGWNNRAYFEVIGGLGLGLSAALLAWSRYSALRHRRGAAWRGGEHRVARDAEIGGYFGLSASALESLRQSGAITVNRPARGEIVLTDAAGMTLRGRHDPLGPAAAKVSGVGAGDESCVEAPALARAGGLEA